MTSLYETLLHPTKEDLQYRWSLISFQYKFGGWKEFLQSIGEYTGRPEPTKDQLIKQYWDLKTKLGRIPTGNDLKQNKDICYTISTYMRMFGSYTQFLIDIGEREKPTKELITQKYFQTKKKLGIKGRPLKEKEFKNNTDAKFDIQHSIDNLFKKYEILLAEIGEVEHGTHHPRYISNTDLINNYQNIKRIIGKQPTSNDINFNKYSKYSSTSYVKVWGTWSKFIIAVGDTPFYNYSEKNSGEKSIKYLISRYEEIRSKIGKDDVVTATNWQKSGGGCGYAIKAVFGTWANFIEQMRKIPKPEYLSVYCRNCDNMFNIPLSNPPLKIFCSQTCQEAYHKRRWKRGIIDTSCRNCKKPLIHDNKVRQIRGYCDVKCRSEYQYDISRKRYNKFRGIKKEKLKQKTIEMYKILSKKLGGRYIARDDWVKEYFTRGLSTILTNFGGFPQINEKFGISRYLKTCQYCKKEFEPIRADVKYCCNECQYRYNYGRSVNWKFQKKPKKWTYKKP